MPHRKRLTQPVIPALPHIPVTKKQKIEALPNEPTGVVNRVELTHRRGRRSSSEASVTEGNGTRNDGVGGVLEYGTSHENDALIGTTERSVSSASISEPAQSTSVHDSSSSHPPTSCRPTDCTPPATATASPTTVNFPPHLNTFHSRTSNTQDIVFLAQPDSESRTPTRDSFEVAEELPELDMPRIPRAWVDPRSGLAYGQREASVGSGSSSKQQSDPPAPPGGNCVPSHHGSYPDSMPFKPQSFSVGVDGNLPVLAPPVLRSMQGFDNSFSLSDGTPSFGSITPSPVLAERSVPKSGTPSFSHGHFDQSARAPTEPSKDRTNSQSGLSEGVAVRGEYYRPMPVVESMTMVPLSQHLSQMFVTKDLSDWGVTVSSPTGSFISTSYHVHGMILLRSPALRQLMREQHASGRRENVIYITSPDRYIQPPIFEAALRHLYDDTLLIEADLEQQSAGYFGPLCPLQIIRNYQFDCAVSYMLSGLVLGMAAVRNRGQTLIAGVLNWDILELAMSQALILAKPGIDVVVPPPMATFTSISHAKAVDSSSSAFTISETPVSQHSTTDETSDVPAKPHDMTIEGIVGTAVKQAIFSFMAKNLKLKSFKLDTSAPKFMQSYLPPVREYSSSSTLPYNPDLANVRFGSMPLLHEPPPVLHPQLPTPPADAEHTAVSAILLNASYRDLLEAFEVMKAQVLSTDPPSLYSLPELHDFAETIVSEREQRRQAVIDSKTVSNEERMSKPALWNIAGWEESIQNDDNADGLTDWRLGRVWTGFERLEKRPGH